MKLLLFYFVPWSSKNEITQDNDFFALVNIRKIYADIQTSNTKII